MHGGGDLSRLAAIAAAALAILLLTACVTEKPVMEATGAAVGAGIDVPPGSNEDFIVNVGRRTYFDESSAELNDVAKTTLQKQAGWLSRYSRYKIKIVGYADDRGGDESNRALGLRRAEAVKSYLASVGVSPARIRTKTYGKEKERLVNDCDDVSCRAQNRRAVTVLESDTGV